jgi:hypothetical protein
MIFILLPAYNESKNLKIIFKKIKKTLLINFLVNTSIKGENFIISDLADSTMQTFISF